MKLKLTMMAVLIALGASAQNTLHNASIVGSIQIGNKEVTTVLDENTGCSHKSRVHNPGLFSAGENVQLDMDQMKIIKPTLPENVFINDCAQNPGSSQQMTAQQFKENVAIIDLRVRSVNSTKHVKEVMLADFSGMDFGNLKRRIVIHGVQFSDEGVGHDRVAHDGLYTSLNAYDNGDITFDNVGQIKDRLTNPIVDPAFNQNSALDAYLEAGEDPTNPDPQPYGIEISCDVALVDCPNTNWWNTSLFGEPCIEITNCTVTFTL